MRAPTLHEKPALVFQFCDIFEVTSAHALSREGYAACLLDSLENADHPPAGPDCCIWAIGLLTEGSMFE